VHGLMQLLCEVDCSFFLFICTSITWLHAALADSMAWAERRLKAAELGCGPPGATKK